MSCCQGARPAPGRRRRRPGSGIPGRRAWRGAQHRGAPASVQASPCSSAGLMLQFLDQLHQQRNPGPVDRRQAVGSRRPCRQFEGNGPASESTAAPGCRGRRAWRRRLDGPPRSAGSRIRRAARRVQCKRHEPSGSSRTDFADFVDQQFPIDAGRNASRATAGQLGQRARPSTVLRCRPASSDA